MVTDSLTHSKKIKALIFAYNTGENFDALLDKSPYKDKIKNIIPSADILDDVSRKKAIIISSYYLAVEKSKGEYALQLSVILKNSDGEFNVPSYIQEAMQWLIG